MLEPEQVNAIFGRSHRTPQSHRLIGHRLVLCKGDHALNPAELALFQHIMGLWQLDLTDLEIEATMSLHTLAAFRSHMAQFLERMQQRNLSELSITADWRDLQQLCDLLAEKLDETEDLTSMHLRHVLMRLSQKA